MEKIIFRCEDSTDGIFTGVYDAWASKLGHSNVALQSGTNINYELFTNYVDVPVDHEKAYKVANTIREKMVEEDYEAVYQATLSKENDKADAIYRMIVLGLSGNYPGPVIQNLGNPHICRVFELSRNVGNEAHHYLGFVRFKELQNKILSSVIEPENKIIPVIGDHFANRFPNENFLLFDKTHQMLMVHEVGKDWVVVSGDVNDPEKLYRASDRELEFQELWIGFCKSIGITERKNQQLQRKLVPLKRRKYMPEFK